MAGRTKLIAGLVSALVLGVNACDASNVADNPDPPMAVVVPVQMVKVTPQTMQVSVGEVAQLTVAIGPANATDKAVTWESSEPTIASVDTMGRVRGNAVGEGVFVTVYTHDGHLQASANVTVNP